MDQTITNSPDAVVIHEEPHGIREPIVVSVGSRHLCHSCEDDALTVAYWTAFQPDADDPYDLRSDLVSGVTMTRTEFAAVVRAARQLGWVED